MSNRKYPHTWQATRQHVINRAGGLCQAAEGCLIAGTEVDHIVPRAVGGSDTAENLQLLCQWHHRQKTNAELKQTRKKISPPYRETLKHPGKI